MTVTYSTLATHMHIILRRGPVDVCVRVHVCVMTVAYATLLIPPGKEASAEQGTHRWATPRSRCVCVCVCVCARVIILSTGTRCSGQIQHVVLERKARSHPRSSMAHTNTPYLLHPPHKHATNRQHAHSSTNNDTTTYRTICAKTEIQI